MSRYKWRLTLKKIANFAVQFTKKPMLSHGPLISVILCVYNVEPYIRRCARSVFGQTYPNIDFIFVDDGSPDKSIEILEDILDKEFSHLKQRVTIVRQPNAGLPGARMAGLKAAKGDYVLFLDPDDWCKTSMVEKLVEAAVNKNADVVVCNYFNAYRYIVVPRREKKYDDRSSTLRALMCHHHFRGYLWDKLVKRELYQDLYDDPAFYFPKECHCEDLVMTAQVVHRADEIAFIKDRLVYYNKVNPHSASKRKRYLQTSEVIHNIMGLFMHYHGSENSPFKGIEEPVLLSVASQIVKIHAPEMFDEYPVIMEVCAPLIESFPNMRVFKDIPFRTQRKIKEFFKALKDGRK